MKSNQCQRCEKSAAGRISLSSCENLFGLATENAPLGIAAVKDGEVLYSNPACAQILGYDGREVVGTKIINHIIPEKQGDVISFIHDIRRNGLSMFPCSFFETVAQKKCGSAVHLRIRLARVETQCCDLITLCYITDVTEQIRRQEELERLTLALEQLSVTDPLTGLFNRRYMEEQASKIIQRADRDGSSVGIIVLDIDHFKKYNDDFGHDAGDAVLKGLSELLMKYIRPGDIACRYGGEEFLLILPGASKEITRQRAEDILEAVRSLDLNHRGNGLGQITISAGVAVFPKHGGIAGDLIRAADIALYHAKEAGRDRVVVAV